MYWVCVERKSRFFSPFLLFLLYSILDPPDYIFFTYLYSVGRPCSIWTQSTARLYTSSQCALCAISEKSAGAQVRPSASVHLRVPSRSSSPPCVPSCLPPPPPLRPPSAPSLPPPGSSRLLSSPREHHGYIYGGVVRGQGQQEPPLSLLQPPRQSRRERATAAAAAAASPPPPSPPSSRDAPRAPPAPSSPPPRREATLRRAAAAEQQRGLQHTGTAAQQDEGVEEIEAQDGPRWATPPHFSLPLFFFFFFFSFLFFFFFFFPPTVLHPVFSARTQPDLTRGHFSRVCGC